MRLWLSAFCIAAALSAPAAAQTYELEARAATELREICAADRGQLWGADLCGPLIIVDPATRRAWATQRDNLNTLALTPSGGWTGVLPDGVPIANTSVDWGGVRWIMVMGPLPQDDADRRVLITHEAWHRIQNQIALPQSASDNAHLESERGRYLLRLEMRALATALLSNGRARRDAARDAIAFRLARHMEFPAGVSQEAALDRNEGLASYTGVKLGAGASANLFAARTLSDYDTHNAYARAYAYATGPAYGLLLDEYDPDWRATLAAYAPADLLVVPTEARRLSTSRLQSRANRYGGEQIALEERTRAERQRQLIAGLRTRFAEGPRLELPLNQAQFEFDPTQVTPVPGLGSVYQTLTIRADWGELRASQGALISADFSRLTAANPGPGGLTGPGWVLSLTPAYRLSGPDASGRLLAELAPLPPPLDAQADN